MIESCVLGPKTSSERQAGYQTNIPPTVVYCCIYPEQRNNLPPFTKPPRPVFDPSRNHWGTPRNTFTTCITRISSWMLESTECTSPHPETPWRLTEADVPDKVQIFVPTSSPGDSKKEEWMDSHMEFMAEIEDDPDYLTIYSDDSLTTERGRR